MTWCHHIEQMLLVWGHLTLPVISSHCSPLIMVPIPTPASPSLRFQLCLLFPVTLYSSSPPSLTRSLPILKALSRPHTLREAGHVSSQPQATSFCPLCIICIIGRAVTLLDSPRQKQVGFSAQLRARFTEAAY